MVKKNSLEPGKLSNRKSLKRTTALPRRKALGIIAAGLVSSVGVASTASAQDRTQRRPPTTQPVIQRRPSRRPGLALGRVPRRTLMVGRNLQGSALTDELSSLLQDDLRLDQDRVQGTLQLIETVLGDLNAQHTGLLSVRIGDLANYGVDNSGDDCGMLCGADQCDKLSCTGNGCEGHTCGTQACDTNSCSGQSCDSNGCHEETTSVMPEQMASSAWGQLAVLREMYSQMDDLFIQIEHTQIDQVQQFHLR